MVRIFSIFAICLALALPARADEDAQAVISNQISAFKADDFETAFTFASPMIQGIFGTPDRFGQMVRNGYPMVWRPAEVEFLEAEPKNGALVQHVLIRDAQGVYYELEYEMIRGDAGWKINGVKVKRRGEGLA